MKPKNNKDVILKVRCTIKESEEIKMEAKNYKNVSDFLRRKIFNKGSSCMPPLDLVRVMDEQAKQLRYIGNNINQLARYANQKNGTMNNDDIIDAINSQVLLSKEIITLYRKIISL